MKTNFFTAVSKKSYFALLMILTMFSTQNVWGVSYTKVTSLADVETGDYVIVGCKTSSSYGILTYGSMNSGRIPYTETYTSYSSLPTEITDPADGSVFTLTVTTLGSTKSVTIYNVKNEKYIKSSAATHDGKYSWDDGTALSFTIVYSSGSYGTFEMYAGDTYYFGVNKSANYWRGYASSTLTATNGLTLYKKASSCTNKVTISKGSETNGSFSLSQSGEQATCSGLAVEVTPTPNTHYHVSSVTATTPTTGGEPTVSGPSSGKYTVTYATNSTGSSTINVTFTEDTKYTVTWYNEGTEITGLATGLTSVYSGEKVSTLPSTQTSSCYGTFVGWAIGSEGVVGQTPNDDYLTVPTTFTTVAGSPTITADTEFHAVYKKN